MNGTHQLIAHSTHENQLDRLHINLIYPSVRNLNDLLRKADVHKLPSDTLNTLKDISNKCDTYNIYRERGATFQIRDMDKIKFNHRILLDVMYLQDKKRKSRPLLQIVDARTRFNAATLLYKLDTKSI